MINKLSYFLLIVGLLFAALRYQEMGELDCASAGERAQVSVRLDMPDPELNTDLSYAQITQKFRSYHGGQAASPYLQALGVTEFFMDVQFQLKFLEKMKSFTGQACLIPEKVDVVLILKQTIFLGQSSTRSKCQFKTLMDHEMRHVTINRDITQKNLKKFEESVRAGIANYGQYQGWGPYELQRSSDKKEKLKAYMDSSIKRVAKETENEINRLQSKVDTPGEYMRIGRACRW
jgi:hypothetical protein